MDTPKETMLAVLRSMPDDATWEQIRYRADLVTGVELGMEDVAAGRTIPHEQVMEEMSRWLESLGRREPVSEPTSSLSGSE
jgi:hypothetical protein